MTEHNDAPEAVTQFNPEAYNWRARMAERGPSSALVRMQHAALDAIKAELQRQVDHPIELALYLDIDTESCAVIDGHVDLDAIAAAVVKHLLETQQRDSALDAWSARQSAPGSQFSKHLTPEEQAAYDAWKASQPNPTEENDR